MPTNIRTLEQEKFNEAGAVRVVSEGLLAGVSYDKIQVSYPNSLIEEYSYFLSGVQQIVIRLTFEDTEKERLLEAEKL